MKRIMYLKQWLVSFLHIMLNGFEELFENEEERDVLYKGVKLFYSNHTSIVDRFISEGDYEPIIQNEITNELKKHNNPVFLDIGANIGMISLGILSKIPQCVIYAFEPAPHQFNLFRKTIQFNQLSNRITLYNIALSNKNAYTNFVVHKKKHAAGDGFIDTGRGGKIIDNIEVQVKTLDSWWIENGRVKIDFIKIDTEGAELWVLEGGKECITQCEPGLIIEIYQGNLKNYPYTKIDIINLIYSYGYFCRIGERFIEKDDLINNFPSEYVEFTFVTKKADVF